MVGNKQTASSGRGWRDKGTNLQFLLRHNECAPLLLFKTYSASQVLLATGPLLKITHQLSEMKEEGGWALRLGWGRGTLSQTFRRGSILGPHSGLFATDPFSRHLLSLLP